MGSVEWFCSCEEGRPSADYPPRLPRRLPQRGLGSQLALPPRGAHLAGCPVPLLPDLFHLALSALCGAVASSRPASPYPP